MSDKQVTKVIHAHQTGIDYEKLRTGKLEEHEWATYHQKIGPLLSSPIFIDDTPSISITELRAKARRMVSKNNVSLIVIDYLQLMTDNHERGKRNGNREQEISEISRGCKAMAK
jgi:replicative DNA helicase